MEISIITKWKVTVYEESDNVFTSASSEFDALPEDVKDKALTKMNEYYNDNADIKNVVDGNNSDCNTCIFAFEGLGDHFGDYPTGQEDNEPYKYHKDPYYYLNALMVVTKGRNIVYKTGKASTLPDERPNDSPGGGITTMFEGIYDYKNGYHNGYAALRLNPDTNRKGWYKDTEDGEFYSQNCKGINIHACGVKPALGKNANSQGCQIINSCDYVEFGKAVGFLSSTCADDDPTSYITDSFKESLGESSKVLTEVNVKYILDRTYDKKNSFYKNDESSNCKNGIFYPINHDECHTKCINCEKE